MLTDLLFDSKFKNKEWYLGKKIKDMDKILQSIKPPMELTRCPHSILERSYWKASEWRNFLMYYSVVCFKKLMSDKKKVKYYHHCFLFVYSINIFNKKIINDEELLAASAAIRLFVL